jgi:hypothetical protein
VRGAVGLEVHVNHAGRALARTAKRRFQAIGGRRISSGLTRGTSLEQNRPESLTRSASLSVHYKIGAPAPGVTPQVYSEMWIGPLEFRGRI